MSTNTSRILICHSSVLLSTVFGVAVLFNPVSLAMFVISGHCQMGNAIRAVTAGMNLPLAPCIIGNLK